MTHTEEAMIRRHLQRREMILQAIRDTADAGRVSNAAIVDAFAAFLSDMALDAMSAAIKGSPGPNERHADHLNKAAAYTMIAADSLRGAPT